MCDPCIELLDISSGFKERCVDIFQSSMFHHEDAAEVEDDEMAFYETEEYVEDPMEDLQLEHTEGNPFHESVLDEDMTLFEPSIKPDANPCPVPDIRASTEQPTTSRERHNRSKVKTEPTESVASVDKSSSSDGVRARTSKSRMSYTSSKKLEVSLSNNRA